MYLRKIAQQATNYIQVLGCPLQCFCFYRKSSTKSLTEFPCFSYGGSHGKLGEKGRVCSPLGGALVFALWYKECKHTALAEHGLILSRFLRIYFFLYHIKEN